MTSGQSSGSVNLRYVKQEANGTRKNVCNAIMCAVMCYIYTHIQKVKELLTSQSKFPGDAGRKTPRL